MSNEQKQGDEKVAGTNLTPITEYAQTALALADLESRYKGVVFQIETPKGLKEAKQAVSELRGYRTDLEKMRTELKAPVLECGRLLDSEAKRITESLRSLEDPIKAQVDAREAEIEAEKIRKAQAEQARVDGHMDAIRKMREFPMSLQGKPSAVMNARIEEFKSNWGAVNGEAFEEFQSQASDAYGAALMSCYDLHARQKDHEAEQEQIRKDREKLAEQQREIDRLKEEAAQRAEADARRVREEAEERARTEQAERERVEAEQRKAREAEEASERARLAEITEQQRQAQAKLDAERAAHAAQVEKDRIAKLGLMDAVRAVVEYAEKGGADVPRCILDLCEVYYALPEEKCTAAKPVKAPRKQA